MSKSAINNMDNNTPQLDDELAELTDKMLAGQDMPISAENEPLARVLKQLHQITSGSPNPAYRSRLTRRLNEEWDRVQQRQSRALFARPVFRFAALAAAVVLVLGAVLIVLGPGNPSLPATVVGQVDPIFAVVFILALVLVGAVIWSRRR
jgi:hypothetical protein